MDGAARTRTCQLTTGHGPRHVDAAGATWEGTALVFERLGDGYVGRVGRWSYAVYSSYVLIPRLRVRKFQWDLEVRNLAAAPGIRHRVAAPLTHHGRYRRRWEAYAVALEHAGLAGLDPDAARWAVAHELAGVPRCDVPPREPAALADPTLSPAELAATEEADYELGLPSPWERDDDR